MLCRYADFCRICDQGKCNLSKILLPMQWLQIKLKAQSSLRSDFQTSHFIKFSCACLYFRFSLGACRPKKTIIYSCFALSISLCNSSFPQHSVHPHPIYLKQNLFTDYKHSHFIAWNTYMAWFVQVDNKHELSMQLTEMRRIPVANSAINLLAESLFLLSHTA